MKELPCRHLLDQSQQWQHLNNLWNLLKVNNKDTRTLLLTLSRFHTLVWCFHCWLWPRKCRQGISKETNNNLNIAKNVKDGWMISLLFCSLIWLRAFFHVCECSTKYSAGSYQFKFNNENTRTMCEICKKPLPILKKSWMWQ